MPNKEAIPEIKQLLGALIFGSNHPLTTREMRKCLVGVAEKQGGDTAVFAEVDGRDIRSALKELGRDVERAKCGFSLQEVAGGFRFQSDANAGRWLKHLLGSDRPRRLSRPALETLAIIAYRQPITKPDIESVRGVAVDHMIKTLMEMQLVRIAGRSELPGRPFLYGTTHSFLEHFGLKDMKALSDIEPMLILEREKKEKRDKKKDEPVEPVLAEDEEATEAEVAETVAAAETDPKPEKPAAAHGDSTSEVDDDEDEYDDESEDEDDHGDA